MKNLLGLLLLITIFACGPQKSYTEDIQERRQDYLETLFPKALNISCVDPERGFYLVEFKDKYYTAVMCVNCHEPEIAAFYGVD